MPKYVDEVDFDFDDEDFDDFFEDEDDEPEEEPVMAMLVCTDKIDDKLGYDITKALFSNLDRIKAAHAVGKFITKEKAMEGMPITMNAGAEKFFKE